MNVVRLRAELLMLDQVQEVAHGYMDKGKKKILTTCPHCFNILLDEYPDFGGRYEVVHHTDFLLGLVAEKKLVPERPVQGKLAYHDSYYLRRYNRIYESPREILAASPVSSWWRPAIGRTTRARAAARAAPRCGWRSRTATA
jgi:Fe-S oxidoreductase